MIRLLTAALGAAAIALSLPAFARGLSVVMPDHPAADAAPMILAQHAHGAPPAVQGRAGQTRVGPLLIEAPWTRATPGGAKVAGGYMRITNTGAEPDRLVGGSFPLAGRFEVHEMAVANGVMTMRELAAGLEIAPGQTVELKPGGYHLMFMELREQVRAGAPIRGTLIFARAGSVEIEYQVTPVGARAPSGHGH